MLNRVRVMLLVAVVFVFAPLAQTVPVDVDGDGMVGPREVIDLAENWKGPALQQGGVQPWQFNGNDIFYNAGNIGIGTATPTSKLEIIGQNGLSISGYQPFLTLRDTNAGGARHAIQNVNGGVNLLTEDHLTGSNPFAFVRVDPSGNIGVGTADPTSRVEIIGQNGLAITGFQPYLTLRDTNAGGARGLVSSGNGDIGLYTESSIGGSPTVLIKNGSGNLGVGTAAPVAKVDARSGDSTPAIHAEGSGPGGTAIEISSGAIRVPGAGANSQTPAFVHVTSVENSRSCDLTGCYCFSTVIDHPMTNGRPDAILLVTVNGRAGSGEPMIDHIDYESDIGRWVIAVHKSPYVNRWFCVGQKFNVLVINP